MRHKLDLSEINRIGRLPEEATRGSAGGTSVPQGGLLHPAPPIHPAVCFIVGLVLLHDCTGSPYQQLSPCL